MTTFSYNDLQAIIGDGASSLPKNIVVNGLSTDTRTIETGNVFVALTGENFDGHDFVDVAFEKGAITAVINVVKYPDYQHRWRGKDIIPVPDTLHALGSFGWYHRRRFDIPVIAIGGAAGKTSTKDITAHVLGMSMNVLKTEMNYNNRIGTPLTLLKLSSEHQAAVIEIGTNEPGEIETLSAMVQPTHGLITNIGKEHLEKLVDLDGVENEETALFDYLHDTDGLLFVNMDDERLHKYGHQGLHGRAVTFGIEHDADINPDVTFDKALHPIIHMVKDQTTFRAEMQTQGLASAYNAACAIAIAWSLNCGAESIKRGLQTFTSSLSHGYARLVIENIDGLVVLNDTYNANPESMKMSLKTLSIYPANRRLAVLGDMFELGESSSMEHLSVLEEALQHADLVITLGEAFHHALQQRNSPHAIEADDYETAAHLVKENSHSGTAVLIKGSRGMQMENVLPQLHALYQ